MPRLRWFYAGLGALALATLSWGCQDTRGVTAPTMVPRFNELLDSTTALAQTHVTPAYMIVCKDAPAGSPEATFTIRTDYKVLGGPEGNVTSVLQAGRCRWLFLADNDPYFWVYEPADLIPAGWHLVGATVYTTNAPPVELAPEQLVNIRPFQNEVTGNPACWIDQYLGCMVVVHNAPDDGGGLTATKTAAGTYDRTVRWDLTKTVTPTSHSGTAGQTAGSSTWTVTATKSETTGNYRVTGQITVDNPGMSAVAFTVTDQMNDGTVATVSCPSSSVPARGSVVCGYEATPANGSATLNTATLTGGGRTITATAPVSFTASVTGDESVTLADPRFGSSQVITGTTTLTFPESFPCSNNAADYTGGTSTRTVTNTATLTGAGTSLSGSASVQVTCTMQTWSGETATGAGTRYPNTSNWFTYSAYTTGKVDFIAGRKYDAGDIYMSRSGSTTTIRITLQNGFRWTDVADNLKIQPFDGAPTDYLQPGAFQYKFSTLSQLARTPGTTVTYNAATGTVTVTLPGTSARYYGIHGDVQRPL